MPKIAQTIDSRPAFTFSALPREVIQIKPPCTTKNKAKAPVTPKRPLITRANKIGMVMPSPRGLGIDTAAEAKSGKLSIRLTNKIFFFINIIK